MSSSSTRPLLIWGGLGVVAAGALAWLLLSPKSPPPKENAPPDMVAVLQANNRGVGFMDQYAYAKAVPAFEKVVAMAPDWLPGRINLGIALLNLAGESQDTAAPELGRALALFEDVLRQDKDNPYAHYSLGMTLAYTKHPEEAESHFRAVTRIDPNDAHGWFRLGLLLPDEPAERLHCFERARRLNPYLTGATYNLAMQLRLHDPGKVKTLLAEQEAL